MKKYEVVRSKNNMMRTNGREYLEKLLCEGYRIIHSTSLGNEYIEYVLEKKE